jgi:hypothetical protein
MAVPPSSLVVVWIIFAGWLQSLEICEVEGLLRVSDELPFLEFRHVVISEIVS